MIANGFLRYGICLLIWHLFNWRWAVVALVGGWLISKGISQIYFNRESEKWIQQYKRDARATNPEIDEKQLRKEAYKYASVVMLEHTKAKR